MTVSTVETRKTYNGNGVTDAFATSYFLADDDLVVYVDNALQTITTDYTVAGAGVPAGGTVTFVTPPPSGSGNVVILVDPELTQLTDWVENDRNGAEVKETAFDKLTIIAQRLADRINRGVQLSETDTATTLTVPELADRLSKFLAFDANGDLIAVDGGTAGVPVSAFMTTILDDADAAEALTTLGFSTFVQTLLDDADAAAFRTSLGIGVASPAITATDADLTITTEQFAAYDTLNLDLSAWTAARNVIVPAIGRNFTLRHNAGTYTATVKTAVGTGIPVAAGTSRTLVCDGTNVVDLTSSAVTIANFVVSNWTTRTSAADNLWYAITWSPGLGLFAAVAITGTGNRVMTSPDGITWTIRTSAADNSWRSIAWSPGLGLFAAVASTGTGNRVMTSPDGITWTTRTSAADNDWFNITWSPGLGLFAAVALTGTGNRVMTSPDGITWTIRTSAANNDWRSITWSPELGLFAAVASSGTGNRVMTSLYYKGV